MQVRIHFVLAVLMQVITSQVHASPLRSDLRNFDIAVRQDPNAPPEELTPEEQEQLTGFFEEIAAPPEEAPPEGEQPQEGGNNVFDDIFGPFDPSSLDATPEDVALCEGPLTPERWTELGYANAMRMFLAQGYETTVDRAPYQVILDRASRMDQFFCSFNDTVNVNCEPQDVGSQENCEIVEEPRNDPRAMTMLVVIANFARFMMSAANAARDAMMQADMRYQEFIDTFQVPQSPLPNLGALGVSSSPFILLGAIFGAIPVIGGILGVPMGVIISANNPLETIIWEPRFDDFVDTRLQIGNLGRDIQELIRRAGDMAVNWVPNTNGDLNAWLHDPTTLPAVLEDGRFALATSQTVGTEGLDLMRGVMNSALINKIWIDSEIYVVRFSRNAYPMLNGGDICGDHTADIPFARDVKWCDEEGYAYVLQRWHGNDQSVPGWDQLENFNTNKETVFRNSWAWQQRWGFGKEIAEDNVQELFDIRMSQPDIDPMRFQVWNLPVCDLDNAFTAEPLNEDNDWVTCEDNDDPSACFFKLQSICRCQALEGWPYEARPMPGWTGFGNDAWPLTCFHMNGGLDSV